MSMEEYEKTCFVIMPFGEKPVRDAKVDFNKIYKDIFEPAIMEANPLEARRTDHDKFSSSITQDMFELIFYSRMALADISGLNANALYELGARHALQESGTVILRQKGHSIPFDIGTIKVFEYDHSSKAAIRESRAFIAEVLANSLERNRMDSPIRQALNAVAQQRAPRAAATDVAVVPAEGGDQTSPAAPVVVAAPPPAPVLDIETLIREAEEAAMKNDTAVARTIYRILLKLDPTNVLARMKLGLVLRREGKFFEAQEEFATLVRLRPDYAEAWREKGVMESYMIRDMDPGKRGKWAPHGHHSFRKAVEENPKDADAWSAWGGLMRRIGDEPGALDKYKHAAEVSDGHPYPLLNAVKLEAKLTKSKKVSFSHAMLQKAREKREAQTKANPPQDTPWSFFDLAEIKLFQGDQAGFQATVEEGIGHAQHLNELESFRDGLKGTLVESGIDIPGLSAGMKKIEAAIKRWKDD